MKNKIQDLLHYFGYHVCRLAKSSKTTTAPSPTINQNPYGWLKKLPIKTFIDVGAHSGEYVDWAAKYYPSAKIFAFEPLQDYAQILFEKQQSNSNLSVYNNAIGETNEKKQIQRSCFAPSSSLLKMGKIHEDAFPHSKGHTLQDVDVITLDSFFDEKKLENDIFIKVDTQGYEDKVILGGINTFKKASIVQLEVSFYPLYEGQVLFDTIYTQMTKLGFLFHGIKNQVCSPEDGTILQAHAYFIKNKFL